MLLLSSADFFTIVFSKNSFKNTVRMSNGVDPDQNRHSVGSNCWSKTVCKGYQQTKKSLQARKELKNYWGYFDPLCLSFCYDIFS